jgi:diacylglycerol O-acyltransferase
VAASQHVGNQITFILANLATHLADPVARLKTINGSTKNSKKRNVSMPKADERE